MTYCTRIAEVSWGVNTPLNFLSVTSGDTTYSQTITLTNTGQIETFLNSLGIGIFEVSSITNGIRITTLCNGLELDSVSFEDSDGVHSASFNTSDCDDNPCPTCDENCFDSLIGLRDVCSPGNSCIMMNDLGISRSGIESIMTKDYKGAEDFFNKQLQHAIKEVTSTIHSNFSDKYIAGSILEGQRLGFEQDNLVSKPANNKYSGIYIELLNSNSYLNFLTGELSLFVEYTGDVQVNVYDVITGNRIDVIVVPCVAGEISTVTINKVFKSKRKSLKLFFAYDTTGINSLKTLIKSGLCCGKTTCRNQYVLAGAYYSNNSTFTRSDLKSSDHTFGMSMVYSLSCNHTDWLCSHKNIIALPLAYRLAANITNFGLNVSPSERVNTKVTINKEELKNNLLHYETKYSQTLNDILRNMNVPGDAKCFQCKSVNRTVLNLP